MEKTQARKIVRELEDKGISLAEIGREQGVTRAYVSMVVNGHRGPAAIRNAIAEKLGWNPWKANTDSSSPAA